MSGRALAFALVLCGIARSSAAPTEYCFPDSGPAPGDQGLVRGVTISCQTWGIEWGSPGFAEELADLARLGANWVAIHPYAAIRADGSLRVRALDPAAPPPWLSGPIAAAHDLGFSILIVPHLAYWGSPFAWRGAIDFPDPRVRERFWLEYGAWIELLARATSATDAFVVGSELDRFLEDEEKWRALIMRVRGATGAKLTYASNWSDFERVGFWDALDAIGVQAYFPLSEAEAPARADLVRGWEPWLERLSALHERTGKPVVFTELGYDCSRRAAREPWVDGAPSDSNDLAALELQLELFRVSLEVLERERAWLRGAFLWKWFVGEPHQNDRSFLVDTPELRAVLSQHWLPSNR